MKSYKTWLAVGLLVTVLVPASTSVFAQTDEGVIQSLVDQISDLVSQVNGLKSVALISAATSTTPVLYHDADRNKDYKITNTELGSVTTLFNSTSGYSCLSNPTSGWLWYAGSNLARNCRFFNGDTNKDWKVDLRELTRVIQFKNSDGYKVATGTVDGFAPVIAIEPVVFRNTYYVTNLPSEPRRASKFKVDLSFSVKNYDNPVDIYVDKDFVKNIINPTTSTDGLSFVLYRDGVIDNATNVTDVSFVADLSWPVHEADTTDSYIVQAGKQRYFHLIATVEPATTGQFKLAVNGLKWDVNSADVSKRFIGGSKLNAITTADIYGKASLPINIQISNLTDNTWVNGQTKDLKWTTDNPLLSPVNIYICKLSQCWNVISRTNNDSRQTVTLKISEPFTLYNPEPVYGPGYELVMVPTNGVGDMGRSDSFILSKSGPVVKSILPTNIQISSPTQSISDVAISSLVNSSWTGGEMKKVSWASTGLGTSTVDIILCNSIKCWPGVMNTPNDGNQDMKLYIGDKPVGSDYYVKVRKYLTEKVSAKSSTFTVVKPVSAPVPTSTSQTSAVLLGIENLLFDLSESLLGLE